MRVFVSLIVVTALCSSSGWSFELDDCFAKDSISCIQQAVFRKAKSFFDQDKIELFGGLSLTRQELSSDDKARSLGEEQKIEEIINAGPKADHEAREDALESYAMTRAGRLFEERSLTWNLNPLVGEVAAMSRSISESIPADIKEGVSSLVSEGRGKKKKLLKALLPFILGLKLKLGAFLVLAYFIIALIAKKALFSSLISLAIAGFIAIRKLLANNQHGHHEVHEVSHGWPSGHSSGGGGYSAGGWDSYGGGGGGHDIHGAYSSNVAHTLAYGGQKPTSR